MGDYPRRGPLKTRAFLRKIGMTNFKAIAEIRIFNAKRAIDGLHRQCAIDFEDKPIFGFNLAGADIQAMKHAYAELGNAIEALEKA